jgi:hypothetical protein
VNNVVAQHHRVKANDWVHVHHLEELSGCGSP